MEPYCDAYVQAAREAVADETSMRYRFVQQSDPLRWLATLDALQARLAAAEAAVLTTEQRAFYAAERAVKDWLELHFERECDWREHSGLESVAWDAYHAMVAAEARIDTTLRGNASAKEAQRG